MKYKLLKYKFSSPEIQTPETYKLPSHEIQTPKILTS